jgi:hypothetical protein
MTKPLRSPVTIADLMTVTNLGPKQVRREIRLGNLPGRFVGRTFTCTADEYDGWRKRQGEPKPRAIETVRPVDLVARRKTA